MSVPRYAAKKEWGCYHCFATFESPGMWVDNGKTPCCPNCMIDSAVKSTDQNYLGELFDKYFAEELTAEKIRELEERINADPSAPI